MLQSGLEAAQSELARLDVWSLVEKVAKACLGRGGKLSKNEIETLLISERT